MRRLNLLRVTEAGAQQVEDLITEEIALSVLAEHRRLAVLMCSPADLEDLVRGFLYTSHFIERAGDVCSVVVNQATWTAFVGLSPEIDVDRLPARGVITSGCGGAAAPAAVGPSGHADLVQRPNGGVAASGVRFDAGAISSLMQEFSRRSEVHRQTGGVHAAALADQGGILLFREDIGRHNAVDKVVGAWLGGPRGLDGPQDLGGPRGLDGPQGPAGPMGLPDKLLLSSGRLTSEIVAKAVRCALPVVVSRSAPTDRAVSLAREAGITLIGFARGRRMNVYAGFWRIGGRGEGIENERTV